MSAAGLPDLSGFCIELSTGPGELCVRLPAGVRACAHFGIETGDSGTIVRSLLGQVNGAMTPLMPFFRVLDAVKAIVDCVQAIPQAIGELSPEPIVQCIPEMVKKLAKLLELIPQLSVPLLVADLVDVLIVGLIAIRGELGVMLAQKSRIASAAARAATTGNIDLQSIVNCAQQNLDAQLANKQAGMAPLNRILDLVNLLLELAQLPPIPSLDTIESLDESALTAMDVAIHALEVAKAAMPV
jgi:hypothetical protein